MTIAVQRLTVQEFLQLPNIEESPAWELLEGIPSQKPMPTLYHSRLQKRLIATICLPEGTQLGWLIDSEEKVVMVFWRDRLLGLKLV